MRMPVRSKFHARRLGRMAGMNFSFGAELRG